MGYSYRILYVSKLNYCLESGYVIRKYVWFRYGIFCYRIVLVFGGFVFWIGVFVFKIRVCIERIEVRLLVVEFRIFKIVFLFLICVDLEF